MSPRERQAWIRLVSLLVVFVPYTAYVLALFAGRAIDRTITACFDVLRFGRPVAVNARVKVIYDGGGWTFDVVSVSPRWVRLTELEGDVAGFVAGGAIGQDLAGVGDFWISHAA